MYIERYLNVYLTMFHPFPYSHRGAMPKFLGRPNPSLHPWHLLSLSLPFLLHLTPLRRRPLK